MVELKTLKDFPDHVAWFKDIPVIIREDLRQEAIAWIKLCEEELKIAFNSCDGECIKSQIAWIKHFFNLTEDDLKEKQ
jgi:hypothetical protein